MCSKVYIPDGHKTILINEHFVSLNSNCVIINFNHSNITILEAFSNIPRKLFFHFDLLSRMF